MNKMLFLFPILIFVTISHAADIPQEEADINKAVRLHNINPSPVSFTVTLNQEVVFADQEPYSTFLESLDALQKKKEFSLTITSKDNASLGKMLYMHSVYKIAHYRIFESSKLSSKIISLSTTTAYHKQKLSQILLILPHNATISTQVTLDFKKNSAIKHLKRLLSQ